MNNLSAAIGCAQIENIKKILIAKRNNFKIYTELFKNLNEVKLIKEQKESKSNYWLIVAVFSNISMRNKFSNLLFKKDLE